MKIIRVFPRRTNATPIDDMAFIGMPTMFAEADEIHISVTFTWDIHEAERLAVQWDRVAPVQIGGPAMGTRGEKFESGMYIKCGYVITSRGCPNKCWFCSVPKREGDIRELPIMNGWNVLDDNLLACSEKHIREVIAMLKRQSKQIEFTGGFEAARLEEWHIESLLGLRLKTLFFAYDTVDDYEPLLIAAKILKDAGMIKPTSHVVRCYVLVGYPKDTIENAEKRLISVLQLGMMPMAMLWRNWKGDYKKEWKCFQREWANPIIVGSKMSLGRKG